MTRRAKILILIAATLALISVVAILALLANQQTRIIEAMRDADGNIPAGHRSDYLAAYDRVTDYQCSVFLLAVLGGIALISGWCGLGLND